jgi:glycerol-3-phosphate acyltransferase PlsY
VSAGPLALAVLLGYLLGSIPSGYLVARYVAGQDPRSQGSGKTGATNIRRLLGWKGFFLVLGMDMLKGAAAVLCAAWLVDGPNEPWAKAVAGFMAVVGHTWPVFLGFRGGRGVAPGGGAMFAMMPEVMILTSLVVGIPTVLLSRYMSLGSLFGAVAVPLTTLGLVIAFHRPWPYFIYAAAAACLVIYKHRDNIERLRSGTERRI